MLEKRDARVNLGKNEYIKTCRRKPMLRSLNTPRLLTPYLLETKGLKAISLSDVLHILMEVEYMVPTFPNLESYYTIFMLQTCIMLGVTPPMIDFQPSKWELFAMWAISFEDEKFQEYLLYNMIYVVILLLAQQNIAIGV
jgi:hypothetical protein